MNSTALLLVPVASLGILATAPTAPQGETRHELLAYLAELDAGMAELAAPAPEPVVSNAFATSGLGASRLQTATGLHSAARGLTAKEDWQRLFPRYARRD